jgi:hypothetical protein
MFFCNQNRFPGLKFKGKRQLALSSFKQKREPPFGLHSLLLLWTVLAISACSRIPSASRVSAVDQPTALTSPSPTTDLPRPTITQPPTQTPEPTLPDTPTPTVSPSPSPSPTSSPTPTLPPYNVTGGICYPGETIPEMTLYLEETQSGQVMELPVEAGQDSYEADLPPGTYIVYAWLPDYSRGGLYSRAVPCGLSDGCDDHSLLPFHVERGVVHQGIDVCDWFAGPFNVPYPPGIERTQLTGNITGNISYIENAEVPRLRLVAFNQDTDYWYWVFTQPGQTSYTLTELPPGTYHVVAYDPEGKAGGYAGPNHVLIDVPVESGATSAEININDWTAPRDVFPPDPTHQ